jgi:hypothetical protein
MENKIMHTVRRIPGWIFILITIISFPLCTSAREKTDVVTLKNGDRITCEIKDLTRGMLTVKTDSIGTFDIKWPDVDKITSKHLFIVQDTGGQIYVGRLQTAAEEWRIQIAGLQTTTTLDHLAIVQIQELEGSRWMRFSGSADLSYTFTKASDLTQFNFSGDVTYRTEKYSSQLSYSSTLGKSKGETDADRKLLTLSGIREFPGKWLAYTQMSFEHNLELQLDRRFSFLGGPGYRIKQSNRSMVTAIAAGAFTQEYYYGEDVTKNAEGFFAIDTQFFKLYSPKFDIVNQLAFLPNFSNRGRRRLEYKSKFRLELLRDFFVTLTFYDSYDSKPPSETASKNDYGFTTGLSWTFRR